MVHDKLNFVWLFSTFMSHTRGARAVRSGKQHVPVLGNFFSDAIRCKSVFLDYNDPPFSVEVGARWFFPCIELSKTMQRKAWAQAFQLCSDVVLNRFKPSRKEIDHVSRNAQDNFGASFHHPGSHGACSAGTCGDRICRRIVAGFLPFRITNDGNAKKRYGGRL